MKASKFSDAQKAFIISRRRGHTGCRDLSQGGGLPGDPLQLEEEVCRSASDRDEVEAARDENSHEEDRG
jgi:hypothetical protein